MRAKFRCNSVEFFTDDYYQAKLTPVQATENQEDQDFNRFTPSGEMQISIDNPKANGYFKPGSSYYLDFTEAKEKNK